MERRGETKVVCVTGASGFIGSWIVKRLLQRGYVVKATVRDINDPKETEHLLALDGAKDRLELFRAELLEEGAFDSAVDGCEGVFHTASPVIESSNPQAEIIDPAVQGTVSVLRSCAKVPTIKRVIVTSSFAAVLNSGKHVVNKVVDETWYADPNIHTERKRWYSLSKTLAEEAAWNFVKEYAVDMVVINPAYVIGPLLQPTLNGSVQMFLQFIQGETYPDSYYPSIDVRDVADAHIQAFEIPSATGRYCLAANMNHVSEILKIVNEHFPTMQLPEKCQDGEFSTPYYIISQEKAKTLSINFISLEVTIKDMIGSLKGKGFVNF